MTGIAALDHVQVAAPPGCEAAAQGFYGALLGLQEIPKPPLLATRGGAWFRVGPHQLHIGVADRHEPATKAHPAFRVDSATALDQLAARLQEAGHEVTWADEAEIPGTTRFHVADPWGNRVELVALRA